LKAKILSAKKSRSITASSVIPSRELVADQSQCSLGRREWDFNKKELDTFGTIGCSQAMSKVVWKFAM
jgi:hypothetical protein